MQIPVHQNAPPLHPSSSEDAWSVILYSHGMGSNNTTYRYATASQLADMCSHHVQPNVLPLCIIRQSCARVRTPRRFWTSDAPPLKPNRTNGAVVLPPPRIRLVGSHSFFLRDSDRFILAAVGIMGSHAASINRPDSSFGSSRWRCAV